MQHLSLIKQGTINLDCSFSYVAFMIVTADIESFSLINRVSRPSKAWRFIGLRLSKWLGRGNNPSLSETGARCTKSLLFMVGLTLYLIKNIDLLSSQ